MINKFAVFSDAHFQLNHRMSRTQADGLTSWFAGQMDAVWDMFQKLSSMQIKLVLHNGDLFEEKTRIPTQVYNNVWDLFNRARVEFGFDFIFNVGNHDTLSRVSSSSLKPFSAIGTVVDECTEIENLTIIPYGCVEPEWLVAKPHVPNPILFLHEDLGMLSYGAHEFVPTTNRLHPDILLSNGWEYIFNGHIHKPQDILNGRVINIGSVVQNDWSESDDRKRYVVYDNGKITSIAFKSPRFFKFSDLTPDARSIIAEDDVNYYRIDISVDDIDDPIFSQWNVHHRIVRSNSRALRLADSSTWVEDLEAYMDIELQNHKHLNRDKLLGIGKEIIHDNTRA